MVGRRGREDAYGGSGKCTRRVRKVEQTKGAGVFTLNSDIWGSGFDLNIANGRRHTKKVWPTIIINLFNLLDSTPRGAERPLSFPQDGRLDPVQRETLLARKHTVRLRLTSPARKEHVQSDVCARQAERLVIGGAHGPPRFPWSWHIHAL